MGKETGIKWTDRPGPRPNQPRAGDKIQARQRINVEVRSGRRPHPNSLPCSDCGHIWREGEPRHSYDHYLGYSAQHHYDVQPVCSVCHATRDSKKKAQTNCIHGHPFTPENTLIRPNGTRECRSCRRDRKRQIRDAAWWRAYRQKRRENG